MGTTVTKRDLLLATLSDSSYRDESVIKRDGGLPEGWSLLKQVDTNSSTGFVAHAYINNQTKEIVIAYRGSEVDKNMIDWKKADMALAKDGDVEALLKGTAFEKQAPNAKELQANAPNWDIQFTQGLDFANEIIKKHGEDYKISVTGHSLGGSIAQVASKMHDLPGITFDPAGAKNIVESQEFKDWATAHGKPVQGLGSNAAPTNYIVNKSTVSNYSGAHVGTNLPVSGIAHEDWKAKVNGAWSRHSMPRIFDEFKDAYKDKRPLNIIGEIDSILDTNMSKFASNEPSNVSNPAIEALKERVTDKTTVAVSGLCDKVGFTDERIRGNLCYGMTDIALNADFTGKGTITAGLNGNNITLIEERSIGDRSYVMGDSAVIGNIDQAVSLGNIAAFKASEQAMKVDDPALAVAMDHPTKARSLV